MKSLSEITELNIAKQLLKANPDDSMFGFDPVTQQAFYIRLVNGAVVERHHTPMSKETYKAKSTELIEKFRRWGGSEGEDFFSSELH